MEDLLPRFGLQFLPQFVGAEDEGDVVGAFGIGVTDHPGLPGVGAPVVDVAELLQDERALATAAELPGGGAAHRAAADHDRVVVGHRDTPR